MRCVQITRSDDRMDCDSRGELVPVKIPTLRRLVITEFARLFAKASVTGSETWRYDAGACPYSFFFFLDSRF
jgi:hypothetical protein